jgi:hypothetical protein
VKRAKTIQYIIHFTYLRQQDHITNGEGTEITVKAQRKKQLCCDHEPSGLADGTHMANFPKSVLADFHIHRRN